MPAATDRRPRRSLGVAAATAVAAALVCGLLALAAVDGGGDADTVPATLAAPASTMPPPASASTPGAVEPGATATQRRDAPSATPPSSVPGPSIAPSTAARVAPLSPLNSLLGDAVSVTPVAPLVDVAPVGVRIDGILDGAPVISVGVAPDGQLEIPGATEAGWYRLGAAPGQPGATVIAAHVSWRGSTGPFAELADVELGAIVELTLADGTSRRYQTIERAQYGKLMLPKDEIWRTSGPETLVLITCGGSFNPEIRRYADNIVVTAVPVA